MTAAQSFLQKMYDHPSFHTSEDNPVSIDFDAGIVSKPKPVVNLDVQRVLYHYAEQCNVQFFLAGNKIKASQVFGLNQFLPVIGLDAMRIWHSLQQNSTGRRVTGDQPLNAHVEADPNGLFGMRCRPVSIQNDLTSTLRLLVWTLSARRVMGLRLNAHVDLNKRVQAWDAQQFVINWNDPILPQIPFPDDMDSEFFLHEFEPVVHANTHGLNFDEPSSFTSTTSSDTTDERRKSEERANTSRRQSHVTQR